MYNALRDPCAPVFAFADNRVSAAIDTFLGVDIYLDSAASSSHDFFGLDREPALSKDSRGLLLKILPAFRIG
jgi:hypothetical protein